MKDAGVLPGVWFTDPFLMPFCPPDAAFVVAEVETDQDYDGCVGSIPHLDPGMPRAIISNFGGLLVKDSSGWTDARASRERCAPLIKAGFSLQTEFYLSSLLPGATPEDLAAIAINQCGWAYEDVSPVFGPFEGKTMGDYELWMDRPGWGVYLAEYL